MKQPPNVEGYVCLECLQKHRDGDGIDVPLTVYPSEKIHCTGTPIKVRVVKA